jgi:hypothetical protein
MHYENIRAQDQPCQHNGNQIYYGPVIFQSAAAVSVAAAPTEEEIHKGILKSLVFDQMDSRFMGVRQNLVSTCEWLLNASEYRQWRDPKVLTAHHSFFCIKAMAGVGKSTLMKFVSGCAEMKSGAGEHILRFFFNARGGELETSTDGLFRSVLHQLLEEIPGLSKMLDKRRFDVVKQRGRSSELLNDASRDAIMSLGEERVTCFIDAMDECCCEDVQDSIRYFDDIRDSVVAHAKQFSVCLSSRHYPNLRSNKSVELVLDHQQGHNKDIWEYNQRRLTIDDESLKEKLAAMIEDKATEIFLWVVLVVALVNQDDRRGNANEIHKRLEQIPVELSRLFGELLERGTCKPYLRPLCC